MPRIDSQEAVAIGVVSDAEIAADQRTPGLFGPFDLCDVCYESWTCESKVAHPSYGYHSDEIYTCSYCGIVLNDVDD